jgi:alpha-ribazole phosphatase
MKPFVTTIDLLRHGELENERVFCGSTDDHLSDKGWQQMVKALENKNDWDLIITSPMQRCKEFARLVGNEDDIEIEEVIDLQEIDFGDWECMSPDEIMKNDAELLHAWWQSPTRNTPPSGEDYHVFQARVLNAFKNIIKENQGKELLFVTDAGVIRVIMMYALGIHDENVFRINVDYACYTQLQFYHDEASDKACLIKHG